MTERADIDGIGSRQISPQRLRYPLLADPRPVAEPVLKACPGATVYAERGRVLG